MYAVTVSIGNGIFGRVLVKNILKPHLVVISIALPSVRNLSTRFIRHNGRCVCSARGGRQAHWWGASPAVIELRRLRITHLALFS